jgi:DNA topoisomerase I
MSPLPSAPDLLQDAVAAAKTAGLRYSSDNGPGIRRRHCGKGFCYRDPLGELIRDPSDRARIRSLAVPPAWTDVWICPAANGHLQATGRDARGRKQYRYHPLWAALRNEAKFERLLAFGEILPGIRRQLETDLSRPGLPREKVIAVIIRLLEASLIRIGNQEYLRANDSFGLTTMRRHHLELSGTAIHFQFRGKSGKCHAVDLHDRRLAAILNQILDIPGQELFHYRDEGGEVRRIESGDVNGYLAAVTGGSFTAKDFRTWKATVLAGAVLAEIGNFRNLNEGRHKITAAVKRVAALLGNRPATCRRYYIHPEIPAAYLDGLLFSVRERMEHIRSSWPEGLSAHEVTVILVLEHNRDQRRKIGNSQRAAQSGRRKAIKPF